MEFILLGLECHYLVMVKLVSAKYFIIEALGLLTLIAAHVLDDLLPCQVHRTVQAMH